MGRSSNCDKRGYKHFFRETTVGDEHDTPS
jgi:hypothetical protein